MTSLCVIVFTFGEFTQYNYIPTMFFIDNDSQVSRQIYLHSRIMKNLPKSLYRNPSTINR